MKVHYTTDALETIAADVLAIQVYGKPSTKDDGADVDFVFDKRVAAIDSKLSGALTTLARSER